MHNPWRAAIISLSLLVAAWPAVADESVEAAIRALPQQYVAAWNRGDADGAAAVYAKDGTHTYVFGNTHRGRAAIANGLKELLRGPMKGTHLAIETLNVRQLSPEVALEEEAFTVSGLKSPDGTAISDAKGLCLAVYKKIGEEWLGAAVQCMLPPPVPPQHPPARNQ